MHSGLVAHQEEQTNNGEGPRRYFIGADIGGTNLRLALVDDTGQILERWHTSTVQIRDPERVIALVVEGIDRVMTQAGVARSSLTCAGIGVPGVADVDNGIVIATSYLIGWRNVPLGPMLAERLGCAVIIDNDVNLGALGESWRGAASSVDDFVFIAIGTGVGAGILLGGELFRGAGWMAGEIGYMLLPDLSDATVSRGTAGALETVLGGEGIRSAWQRIAGLDQSLLELHATQIFDRAVDGDSAAAPILDRAARTLAFAIHNLSVTINCPLFVLGGQIGVHPALRERTLAVLRGRDSRVQPDIEVSRLGTEAQLLGAVRLATRHAGLDIPRGAHHTAHHL